MTNPLPPNALPAANYVDFVAMVAVTGEGLLAQAKPGEKLIIVNRSPSPARRSGWAESYNEGFKKAIAKDPNAKILGEKFGDTGVAVQLQLIQDALQAYPDMNVIWGSAPTAEAAVGAVAEAGRQTSRSCRPTKTRRCSTPSTAATSSPSRPNIRSPKARSRVDQAVRLIEKKPVMSLVQPMAAVIDKTTVPKLQMDLVLAPASWTPVYSVKAK